MNALTRSTLAALFAGSMMTGLAQNAAEIPKPVKHWKETKSGLLQSDFPYTTACIGAKFPEKNKANKGMALIVGDAAFMCFDTDLLRFTAGWVADAKGGYINDKGVTFNGSHGGHPEIIGEQKFGSRPMPGWADATGSFKDVRPEPFGPLPKSWARWNGHYIVGNQVVLSYSILGTPILDQPGSVENNGQTAFTRTLKFAAAKSELIALICEADGPPGKMENGRAVIEGANGVTIVGLNGAPAGAKLELGDGNRVVLKIAKGTAATLNVIIWKGEKADQDKFGALAGGKPAIADFAKGGPAHWPDPVLTQGVLESSKTPDGAFVTDVLTAPDKNPWKRRVRFGGMDFFADGKRAALSTWDGDIWIVSGIDETLANLSWRRFASGGFETLGLKIVNDVIYTSGRDQITRYHDLNKDGEADFYENFNNEITSSPGFHEFVFDLHTDREGNFYTAKAGPVRGGGSGFGGGGGNGDISAHAGCVLKISKDGSKLEVYATGVRAPNGMGVGPDGQVTTGDNEGTWVPTCPVNWVKPGSFLGVETLAHEISAGSFKQPLMWLSKGWDNSGGGQTWVTSDKWGPFKGELLHCSYGQSSLYLIMKQEVGGQMQGGAVKIPVKFTSSAMRPRFNPVDGQLYNAGLRGWQSNAAKETGFDRVRFTGKTVQSISGLNVTKAGVQLTFTQPLDKSSAEDVQNYSGERWNYKRTSSYGSPEVSVDDPNKKGHDKLEIKSATLSADGKTVTLNITDLKPAMQQLITYNKLKSKEGAEISQRVLHTINAIP